jgi:hypothetical protein
MLRFGYCIVDYLDYSRLIGWTLRLNLVFWLRFGDLLLFLLRLGLGLSRQLSWQVGPNDNPELSLVPVRG